MGDLDVFIIVRCHSDSERWERIKKEKKGGNKQNEDPRPSKSPLARVSVLTNLQNLG